MTSPPRAERPYQMCVTCVMDTTDSKIVFNEEGVCEYCLNYHANIAPHWHTDERGRREIERQVDEIKAWGKGKDFDCLIGLSGGVDSSYLVHMAVKEFGLRPLLYHVDAGWNSQQAVNNIEKLVDGLGLDLYTEVIDWPEMRDLQLAYFKSGVPSLDTPQDHAFFAGLYNFAVKNKVKYILTGANYATECVREPLEWAYHASDLRQIRAIHGAHGSRALRKFPQADIFKFKIYYRFVHGLKVIKPLNYVPYFKEQVMDDLVDLYGWQKYAHKHYESRFTRFFEGYWLMERFGFDKRRPHFSSTILSGQMSRDEALRRLGGPAHDPDTIAADFEYIATKLGVSVDELESYKHAPKKFHWDYPNNLPLIELGTKAMQAMGEQRAVMR
ncbi:MAG: N-acetyl sugar amidotransferase [Caulobacteraceae bacterium]|nr:N-acetyl sugar amidotransferase [Caulobacteraceae bacterium]